MIVTRQDQQPRHVGNVPPHRLTMQSSEIVRRRNLPHWDVPTAAYFVTACLEGSIPARGLLDVQAYRAELAKRPLPKDQTPEQWVMTRWSWPLRVPTNGSTEPAALGISTTSDWPRLWWMRCITLPASATIYWGMQ